MVLVPAPYLEHKKQFEKGRTWICIKYYGTVKDMRGMPKSSVADPDPDPPDPRVFGPPGSGSTSQRYGSGSGSCSGSGSGSFFHHAKIVRKTFIPTILRLLLNFYL
jgi:hypothetical protein